MEDDMKTKEDCLSMMVSEAKDHLAFYSSTNLAFDSVQWWAHRAVSKFGKLVNLEVIFPETISEIETMIANRIRGIS
jgi:hypothetical protein